MSLGNQVEESLKEAEASLRNALAFAARTERPFVCKVVSAMISDIDNLLKMDQLFDKLEERMDKNDGSWGPFSN
jgi:hypothetical protein